MAEWLRRLTRNQFSSEAQVRVLSLSLHYFSCLSNRNRKMQIIFWCKAIILLQLRLYALYLHHCNSTQSKPCLYPQVTAYGGFRFANTLRSTRRGLGLCGSVAHHVFKETPRIYCIQELRYFSFYSYTRSTKTVRACLREKWSLNWFSIRGRIVSYHVTQL